MSETGSSRVTTAPDRSTGVTESLPLATRYRSAAPIEWQGSTVYPMYTEQLPTSSSALSIALLSATPPPGLHSFGLGLSMVDGYIGLDGRQLGAVDIWRNALTGGITFELSATVRGALFSLTPVWTGTEGEPRSWSGNYGVVVDRRNDNRVVLRCSMGEGPPTFTDLVVEVRTAPTDAPTAPQPKLTAPPATPAISTPFGGPVPSTPSSLPTIAREAVADEDTPTEQPPPDTPPPISSTSGHVPTARDPDAASIFGSPIQWEPPIEVDHERASVFLPPDPADESVSATSQLTTASPPTPNAEHTGPNSILDSPAAGNDPRRAATIALATGPSAAVPTETENGAPGTQRETAARSADDQQHHTPTPEPTSATRAIRADTIAAAAPATDALAPQTPDRRRSIVSPSDAPAATPSTPVPNDPNVTSEPAGGGSTAVPELSEPAKPETTAAAQSPPTAETFAPAVRQRMTTPPSGTLKRFGATDLPAGTDDADDTYDDADQTREAEAERPRTVRLGHLTLTTATRETVGIVTETEASSPVDGPDLRIAETDQETTPLRPFEAATRKDHSYRNALYDLAVAMHGRGEQEQAYGLWAQAASAGHAEAAYDLGVVCFRNGDLDQAERWWRTAAHRRVMRAMAALAELLDRRGDHAQARLWRNQAATEYAVATQDRNALEQQDGNENRDQ